MVLAKKVDKRVIQTLDAFTTGQPSCTYWKWMSRSNSLWQWTLGLGHGSMEATTTAKLQCSMLTGITEGTNYEIRRQQDNTGLVGRWLGQVKVQFGNLLIGEKSNNIYVMAKKKKVFGTQNRFVFIQFNNSHTLLVQKQVGKNIQTLL